METWKRIVLFFVLPFIPIMLYPPGLLGAGLALLGVVVGMFLLLGAWLWRGSSRALTLSIFLQGFNVIIRLMMLFPHATIPNGGWDWAWIITNLAGIAISTYLLLRLDQADVRSLITT